MIFSIRAALLRLHSAVQPRFQPANMTGLITSHADEESKTSKNPRFDGIKCACVHAAGHKLKLCGRKLTVSGVDCGVLAHRHLHHCKRLADLRAQWLDALAATVKRATGDTQIGHFVMAITGQSGAGTIADPVYDGIDVITVTFAVVLAAAVLFLLAQLVPQLADLMMPPPLSGS